MTRRRGGSKRLLGMLDESIDEMSKDLGDASFGAQLLSEATSQPGERSVRERQLAQFRASRDHRGFDDAA